MSQGVTETNLYQTATNAASHILGGCLADGNYTLEEVMDMFDHIRDHIVDDLFTVRQAELDKGKGEKVKPTAPAADTWVDYNDPGNATVPPRVPGIGGLTVKEVVEKHPDRAHWACTVGSTATPWIAKTREYVQKNNIDVATLKG